MPDWADEKAATIVDKGRTAGDFSWAAQGVVEHLIAAALREAAKTPEGYVLVPVEPTEEMLYAGRAPVMTRDIVNLDWSVGQHLGRISGDTSWAKGYEGLQTVPKGICAEMVWRAMLAAAPNQEKDDG